ncbi:hypothetical protein BBJ28_00016201 [Nothophytophthora sp. Chile5]|nr:hypothetical protein BBJ28_00016201 [Nothophytophthora sp. Chile5]
MWRRRRPPLRPHREQNRRRSLSLQPEAEHKLWASICAKNPVRRRRKAAARRIQRWWRGLVASVKQSPPLETRRARRLQERVASRAASTLQLWFGFHVYRKQARVAALFQIGRQCDATPRDLTRCWCAYCLLKRLYRQQAQVAVQQVQTWWREARRRRNERLEQAVEVLLRCDSLALDLNAAIQTLQEATRDSSESCRKVTTRLVRLAICELVDGLPDVHMLLRLLSVLKNVATYRQSVAEDATSSETDVETMDVLLLVLQMYRMDHRVVVSAACVLTLHLEKLLPQAETNAQVREALRTADARLRRLRTLFKLKTAMAKARGSGAAKAVETDMEKATESVEELAELMSRPRRDEEQ